MIEIAAASSLEYLPWTATMMRSCLDRHRADDLRFHFLDSVGLPAPDRDRLVGMVRDAGAEITVHPVGVEQLDGFLPNPRFGGHAVWLRLLLSELLPDMPRVLYLDADTFVVDDLTPLWDSDLAGAPFGAVANVVEPNMWHHLTSLGVADPKDVLN